MCGLLLTACTSSPEATAPEPVVVVTAPTTPTVVATPPPRLEWTTYRSKSFQVDIPRNWVKQRQEKAVQFVGETSGLRIELAPRPIGSEDAAAAAVSDDGRGVRVSQVRSVLLPAGPAYLVNSTIDAIQQTARLEETNWFLARGKRVIRLKMWAPAADDRTTATWGRIVKSFRWL